MLHFAIPLSHDRTLAERNPLSVFRNLPARSLEIRPGKFQLVDFFWRGVYGAFDLQHINNPGYNRDRGPVLVPAVRLHLDL
jgi:hypothetical protein